MLRANPSLRFWATRLAFLPGILAILLVATFCIVHLIPGDPALAILGTSATPAQLAEVRHALRLDEPLTAQFRDYVIGIAKGDLGVSFRNGEPVAQVILKRLPTTLALAGFSLALVLLVGVSAGIAVAAVAARRPSVDSAFGAAASILGSLPEYISATLLVLLFALWLRVAPAAGIQSWDSYILPVIALSIAPTALMARVANREASVVLRQDYLRAARAKHLSLVRIYLRHVLPNVMTGVLPFAGLLVTGLVGGAVVVESVFNLPGLGSVVVASVQQRDYPVIQAAVLVLGVVASVASAVVDVGLGALDPRAAEGERP
ncbi:ABC transporter permease [Micromonospora sp. NBC_01392]|uniref:ABC transporter permease n=1 Tax=Micromonospora sp. NBC_01392 TaxID=2903588 RepID=UPI0032567BCD